MATPSIAKNASTSESTVARDSAVTTTADTAPMRAKETKKAASLETGVAAESVVAKGEKGDALPSITNQIGRSGQADFFAPSQTLEFKPGLEKAQIGEVVDALDRSDDRVSVVRLTVVDRQEGLETLQFLLSKHSIPIEGDGSEAKQLNPRMKSQSAPPPNAAAIPSDKKDADGLAEPASELGVNPDEQLVCVYVKADSKLLSDALWQLRNEEKFKGLQVEDAPIEVAELDKFVAGTEVAENERLDAPVVAPKPGERAGLDFAKDQSSQEQPLPARRAMKVTEKRAERSVVQNAPTQESAANTKGRARSVRDLPQQQALVQWPSRVLTRSVEAAPNSAPEFAQQKTPIARNYSLQAQKNPGQKSQPQVAGAKKPMASSDDPVDAAAPSKPVQVLLVLVQGRPPVAADTPAAAPVKHAE
jgi:hypothetical protein